MGLFKPSEGDTAVVVLNGVYKQAQLFTRDGYLYANVSGGFVRLNEDGSTSQPKMRLDHIDIAFELHRDPLGRLCTPDAPKATLCDERKATLLLGAS